MNVSSSLYDGFDDEDNDWWIEEDDQEVQQSRHRSLIVGGVLVPSNTEYPYVGVTEGNPCGSTVIYEDILLTAAHCLGWGFFAGVPTQVHIGGTYRLGDDAVETITVEQVYRHPDFDPITYSNDAMLVKLSRPTTAPLVQLNFNDSLPLHNEIVTVIGYGVTNSTKGSPIMDQLRQVNVSIVQYTKCIKQLANTSLIVDNITQLCAGTYNGGYDACDADSGQPLFSTTKPHIQYGIVSNGDGCAKPHTPALYSRISAFQNFILDGICTLSNNPPKRCYPPTIEPTTMPITTIQPTTIPTISPTTSKPTTIPTKSPTTSTPTYTPTNVPSITMTTPTFNPTILSNTIIVSSNNTLEPTTIIVEPPKKGPPLIIFAIIIILGFFIARKCKQHHSTTMQQEQDQETPEEELPLKQSLPGNYNAT